MKKYDENEILKEIVCDRCGQVFKRGSETPLSFVADDIYWHDDKTHQDHSMVICNACVKAILPQITKTKYIPPETSNSGAILEHVLSRVASIMLGKEGSFVKKEDVPPKDELN